MTPTSRFRSIRFALVALFAAGGLLLWGELAPVDGYVGFRVPPRVPMTGGTLRRQDLLEMTVVVRAEDGQIVARAEQDLGGGLVSPVTPPISLRLPRGDYVVLATMVGRDGTAGSLVGALTLSDDGYHRVDLRPVD